MWHVLNSFLLKEFNPIEQNCQNLVHVFCSYFWLFLEFCPVFMNRSVLMPANNSSNSFATWLLWVSCFWCTKNLALIWEDFGYQTSSEMELSLVFPLVPWRGFVFGFGTFYENCSVLLGHWTCHWRYQFWIQHFVFWFCACLGMCLFRLQKWMCFWSWATFGGFDKSVVGCSGREGSEAGSYCCVSFWACGDFHCILKADFLWSHLENFQAGNAGVVFVSLKWNRGAVVLPRDNIMNFVFNALSAIWIVAFWCMCMNVWWAKRMQRGFFCSGVILSGFAPLPYWSVCLKEAKIFCKVLYKCSVNTYLSSVLRICTEDLFLCIIFFQEGGIPVPLVLLSCYILQYTSNFSKTLFSWNCLGEAFEEHVLSQQLCSHPKLEHTGP